MTRPAKTANESSGELIHKLIDLSNLKQLLSSYQKLTEMAFCLLDAKGKPAITVGFSNLCANFHRHHTASLECCLESWLALESKVKTTKASYLESCCQNGMIAIAFPLVIEDLYLGILIASQFFYAENPPRYQDFKSRAEKFGYDREQYSAALNAIPVLPREFVDQHILFLKNLVTILAQNSYTNLKLSREIAKRKKLEDALRQSERSLRTLTDNIPAVISRFNSSLKRIFFNRAMSRLTQGTPEKLMLTTPHEFTPACDDEFLEQNLREVFATGQDKKLEILYYTAAREKRWAQLNLVPEFTPDNRLESVLVLGRDIHDIKEASNILQRKNKYIKTITEASPGVFYSFHLKPDGSTCMPYISPRITELNGLQPTDVMSDMTEFNARIHPDDLDMVRASVLQSGVNLTPWQLVFRLLHPEKGIVWVEGRSVPEFQADGSTFWYGFFHDITEQKRLEAELTTARKMEILGQVTAEVAHEVRNPLNAILAISEALFKEKELAGRKDFQPYLVHIRTQVNRLAKLMSNLLQLGKYRDSYTIAACDLIDLCHETIELWQSDCHQKPEIVIRCPGNISSIPIETDKNKLQQVIINLLDNAMQSTVINQHIIIEITYSGTHTVALKVIDNGKGVDPLAISKVFDPFYSTRPRGTGLGLTIVKHIIENLGGKIEIRNNLDRTGCSVEIVLQAFQRETR